METQTVTDADGIPSTISRTFAYDPIKGNLKTEWGLYVQLIK
ncbi:hypothetical protein [Paenibacillus periandrae]|nr:hypothetical protein [Paenibacillus periandrae]